MNARERLARERLTRRGLLPFAERFARDRGELLTELLDGTARRTVTRARRELWSLMRDSLLVGPGELAHLFGGWHHSTVTVGLAKRSRELAREYS